MKKHRRIADAVPALELQTRAVEEQPAKPEGGISSAAQFAELHRQADAATSLEQWLANDNCTNALSGFIEELLSAKGRSVAVNLFAESAALSGDKVNLHATAQAIAGSRRGILARRS